MGGKNKRSKYIHRRTNPESKTEVILLTKNTMLPVVKSAPPATLSHIRSTHTPKPKVILLECNKKPALSFLQASSSAFPNNDKKLLMSKPESLLSNTSNKFGELKVFTSKKNLPFPNVADETDTTVSSSLRNINVFPASVSTSSNFMQEKQKQNISVKQNKITSSEQTKSYNKYVLKPILSNTIKEKQKEENNNIKHSLEKIRSTNNVKKEPEENINFSNHSLQKVTTTNNITEKKTEENISYNKYSSDNIAQTKTLELLKAQTEMDETMISIRGKQQYLHVLLTPHSHINNTVSKENIAIKNALHYTRSERMMDFVDYESKISLCMDYPHIYDINSITDDNRMNINDSNSTIFHGDIMNHMSDIRNSVSYIYDLDSIYTSQKHIPKVKVQCTFEDINWMSTPQRNIQTANIYEVKDNEEYLDKEYDCKIKYSWQVIGTSSQTSKVLLQDFLEESKEQLPGYTIDTQQPVHKCDVKYSWQIIGTGTQVALQNYDDTDYWTGVLFTPSIYQKSKKSIDNKSSFNESVSSTKQQCNKARTILSNEYTQTFAEKENQTEYTDCRVKYSWQNLLKQCL